MVKISVIMPVFNDEENIKSSINSVIKQTLTDIEIICIDDGSTDNSLNVLRDFSNKDNRIKVFAQENQGSGKARNKGIIEAQGEYIAFLDSDDYIVDEESFSKLYSEAKKYDMEMVSGGIQFVNNGNISYEFRCFKPIEQVNFKPVDEYGLPWYFYKNIFKREFLTEHDIKFPDLLRGQDPIFFTKILSKLDTFLEVPVLYYSYNTPNENKINTSLKYHDFFVHFYEVFKILMNEKKFNKMILEYSEILINMPNREIMINNEEELQSILKVMDNLKKLYIDYGNQDLLNRLCDSFNEIIQKANIKDIKISIPNFNPPKQNDNKTDSSKKKLKTKVSDNNELNKLKEANDKYSEFIKIKDDQIQLLNSYLDKNHDKILIEEFNEELSKKDKIINDYKDNLELSNSELSYKNSQINSFNIKLDLKDSQLKDFKSKLMNSETEINVLKNEIKDKNQKETTLNNNLKNANNQISQLKNEIKDKNQKETTLNNNLKNANNQIKTTIKQLNEKNTKVSELNNQIKNKQNELNESFEVLNQVKQQYNRQLSKLDTKEYCISCYKKEIENNALEIQYLKKDNFARKFLSPLSYIYLLFKSRPNEISLNFKLYKALKNSQCFDIGYYLNNNKDLQESKWCKYFSPELHYVCNGFSESRKFNKKYFNRNSKKELLDYILNCP